MGVYFRLFYSAVGIERAKNGVVSCYPCVWLASKERQAEKREALGELQRERNYWHHTSSITCCSASFFCCFNPKWHSSFHQDTCGNWTSDSSTYRDYRQEGPSPFVSSIAPARWSLQRQNVCPRVEECPATDSVQLWLFGDADQLGMFRAKAGSWLDGDGYEPRTANAFGRA